MIIGIVAGAIFGIKLLQALFMTIYNLIAARG